MFVFPLAVQQGAGLGPLAAGLALAPYAVAFLVVSLVVDRLVARHGWRVLVGGAVVAGLGYAAVGATAWLAWPDVTVGVLAVPSVVAGAGQASVMVPLFRVVLADVPADRAGTGSGLLTTTQQTSLALGVGILGTLFLTLDGVPSLGMRGAFAIVLAAQLAVFAVVAGLAIRLPDPRR
jgi:MFS family permease